MRKRKVEADLFNKAKTIRNEILSRVEADLKNFKSHKDYTLRKDVQNAPTFLDKGDKLRKIKGMILSAINKAIADKDVTAIKELKKLVDKLEVELLQ